MVFQSFISFKGTLSEIEEKWLRTTRKFKNEIKGCCPVDKGTNDFGINHFEWFNNLPALLEVNLSKQNLVY